MIGRTLTDEFGNVYSVTSFGIQTDTVIFKTVTRKHSVKRDAIGAKQSRRKKRPSINTL